MEKKLYSIAATFNSADGIINAADNVSSAGYKRYDVNTPYPVHGMDDAMKLPPSKLGYFSIVFALTGTSLMLFFIWWITTQDYPNVIGGKPFFGLPAFIPVTFEATVLLCAVFSALTLIVYFFKFPNMAHPTHDTEYMNDVSSDYHGIYIEAKDPKFDAEQVKSLFTKLGASKIYEIYYEDEFLTSKFQIWDRKFVFGLIAIAGFVSFSTYMHLNKLMYIPPFNWMMIQPKVTPQMKSTFFKDGFGDRPPVEGTVARGFVPYTIEKPEDAGELLSNPLQATERNIELGKQKFLTFCSPCHGDYGRGESRLKGQFPNGPTLHSDKITNWKDGQLYHVISKGQNVMPGYERQATRDERWAIVLYIRTLQRALNAKESDLK
jgi:mono/diheme cytochrome c family protein